MEKQNKRKTYKRKKDDWDDFKVGEYRCGELVINFTEEADD